LRVIDPHGLGADQHRIDPVTQFMYKAA